MKNDVEQLKERMNAYLEKRGITVHKFEKACGMSVGLWTRSGNPSGKVLVEALNLYDELSAEWLLRGEGEMLKANNLPDENIAVYKAMVEQMELRLKDKDRLIEWLMNERNARLSSSPNK